MQVLCRLRERGRPAFLVGGALRDHALNRVIRDWDIATGVSAGEVLDMFPRVVPTGLRHGTVTVHHGGLAIEVSTFRGASILDDLSHRDFTVDAMAFDPVGGALLDPHGGLQDLRRGVVKAVLDPTDRLREDPVRALRALRMAAELGFGLDAATRRAIPKTANALKTVAPERIREEMTRLLLAPCPSGPLRRMRANGLLEALLPELMEGHRLRQRRPAHGLSVLEHALHTVDRAPPTPRLRWAGLLHDVGKPRCRRPRKTAPSFPGHEEVSASLAADVLTRLRFSIRERREIVLLIRHHDLPDRAPPTDAELRRFLLLVGPERISDLLALRRADRLGCGLPDPCLAGLDDLECRIRGVLRETRGLRTLRPVLDGEDVKAILGVGTGPELGDILRRIQDRIIEEPFVNTRQRLTAWLRGLRRN
jgi:tRNA nucleotidyltransferase/poly(A) polymerase